MPRLVFPDEGSRLVYQITNGPTLSATAGMTAKVYTTAAATTLADVRVHDGTTTPGAAIPGSALTVSAASLLPLFWGPDGVDTVYVVVGSGPATAVYARTDDRFDALATTTPALAQASKAYARLATPATTQRLRWVSLGDSIAYLKMRWMQAPLHRAFGGGTVYGAAIETGQSGTGWSIPGITHNATTGTVTDATGDFDAWFSGRTNRFATAATRTYGIGGGTPTWDTAKIYYVKGPGALDAGTFKVQVDGVDEAGFTSVSTVAATQGLGIATITKGSVAARTLTVVNLTGVHRIVGVGFEASTAGGLVHAGIAQGGITMTDAVSTAGGRAALSTFLTDFAPDVITLEAKEASSQFPAALDLLLPLLRTAAPAASIIGIGTTPMATDDANNSLTNAQLRAATAVNGATYWDGYTPVVSYAKLVELGWQGDGVHVDDKASAYLAGLLLNDLGILKHPGANVPGDLNAANAYLSGKVGIGTQAPTQQLDVVAGASTHATASIRNTGTTGQDANLNLISGFDGTQGNASIMATRAELRLKASTVGGSGSMATIYTDGSERVRVDSTGKIFLGGATGPQIVKGAGTPEAVVTAPVGSLYMRTDGAAATSLYVKESGTGATGWVAK